MAHHKKHRGYRGCKLCKPHKAWGNKTDATKPKYRLRKDDDGRQDMALRELPEV